MGFSLRENAFGPESLSMCSIAPSVAGFYLSLWIYSPLKSGNWKEKAAVLSILENQTPKKHLQVIYTLLVSPHPSAKYEGIVTDLEWRVLETSTGTEQRNSTVPFHLFCCPLFLFLSIPCPVPTSQFLYLQT